MVICLGIKVIRLGENRCMQARFTENNSTAKPSVNIHNYNTVFKIKLLTVNKQALP